MTTAIWLEDLIDEEWGNPDDDPLSTDQDQPTLAVGGTNDPRRRAVQADEPYIFITDGGNPIVEPRSVGYREEHTETILAVDIETNEGRRALVGTVTDDYGGLVGEVKRICDKYRRGVDPSATDPSIPDPEYDIITFDTFEAEVMQRGADRWGGVWTVRFITFAGQIPQDPVI